MTLLHWLRNFWLTLFASTRYAAVGGTVGAALGLLALWLDKNPYPAFFLGACLPLGPFYLWFSSARQMQRQLTTLQHWRADELISPTEYDELRGQALRWYAERLYGTGGQSKSRRQTLR